MDKAEITCNNLLSRSLVVKVIANDLPLETVQNHITTIVCKTYPVPENVRGCNMPCCVVGTAVSISSSVANSNDVLFVFTVYRSWGETANDLLGNSIETGLVITKEQYNSTTDVLFDPTVLAAEFGKEHIKGIRLIGISGTSESYGAHMWHEIVNDDRSWLSGSGEGAGVHAMSMYDPHYGGIYYTNECSHIFNWNSINH